MSPGATDACSRDRISRSRLASDAWIPALVPRRKKRSSPLCLKERITNTSVTRNVTRVNRSAAA